MIAVVMIAGVAIGGSPGNWPSAQHPQPSNDPATPVRPTNQAATGPKTPPGDKKADTNGAERPNPAGRAFLYNVAEYVFEVRSSRRYLCSLPAGTFGW